MSESFTESVSAKTAFLENFLPTLKEEWKLEKEAYEGVMGVKQDDINERIVLDQLIRDVKLSRLRDMQRDKEDFLVLQETMANTCIGYVDQSRQDIEDEFRAYMKKQDKMKSQQMGQMLDVQSKSLNNLRNYYQDIVSCNADMISDLKKQVDLRRGKLDRLERCIFQSLEELNKFTGPMEAIEREIGKCRQTLEGATALREQYAKKHILRKRLLDDVKRLQWIKEIAMTKVQKYQEEMDHLDKGYFETTFNISQKASLSSLMHSKAYDLMAEEATIYEICFHSLQAVASQDEAVIKQGGRHIQELLQHHRDDIIELHRYGAALKQKHEEVWKMARLQFKKKHRSSLDAFGFHQPKMDEIFPQNITYFKLEENTEKLPDRIEYAGRGNGDVLERVKMLTMRSDNRDNGSPAVFGLTSTSKMTIASA
ncbi:hypothetical protein RvY_00030 [Ramazzottius varieornatus]|uniref:Dynein regulatory complex subunit 4 n=1 Tax=Ramazzottius varieornatus TaxID=947166 RepID=A0A1D1UB79_RAMVA|nr:hypothetical protein RvY_00030 [Ramazzottius varieornatus]